MLSASSINRTIQAQMVMAVLRHHHRNRLMSLPPAVHRPNLERSDQPPTFIQPLSIRQSTTITNRSLQCLETYRRVTIKPWDIVSHTRERAARPCGKKSTKFEGPLYDCGEFRTLVGIAFMNDSEQSPETIILNPGDTPRCNV